MARPSSMQAPTKKNKMERISVQPLERQFLVLAQWSSPYRHVKVDAVNVLGKALVHPEQSTTKPCYKVRVMGRVPGGAPVAARIRPLIYT